MTSHYNFLEGFLFSKICSWYRICWHWGTECMNWSDQSCSVIFDWSIYFVDGKYYWNWYQDWGHCGVTHDLGSSPQPEGSGELTRSLVTPQWPKSRYQFLFYHDASEHIEFMQIRKCISRKSLINCFKSASMESMVTDHCHSSFLSYVLVTIVMSQWCLCH